MGLIGTCVMKESITTTNETELYIPASTMPPHLDWIEGKVSSFLSSIRRMPIPGTAVEQKN